MKKAQLSIMILLGLILFVGLVLYAMTKQKAVLRNIASNKVEDFQVQDVISGNDFLNICIRDKIINAIGKFGFKDTDSLAAFIRTRVPACLRALQKQEEFEFYLTKQGPEVVAEDHDESLLVTVYYNISFEQNQKRFYTEQFDYYFKKSLYDTVPLDSHGLTTEEMLIVSNDGRAVLIIPKGTAILWPTEEREIKLKVRDKRGFDQAIIGNLLYEIEPNGLIFMPDVTLTITYLNEFVQEPTIEKGLSLVWYDEKKRLWIKIFSRIDTERNIVTGTFDHATLFGVAKGCNVEKKYSMDNVYESSCYLSSCGQWSKETSTGFLVAQPGAQNYVINMHDNDYIKNFYACNLDAGWQEPPDPSDVRNYYTPPYDYSNSDGVGTIRIQVPENSCVPPNFILFSTITANDYLQKVVVSSNIGQYTTPGDRKMVSDCSMPPQYTEIRTGMDIAAINEILAYGRNDLSFYVGNEQGRDACAELDLTMSAFGADGDIRVWYFPGELSGNRVDIPTSPMVGTETKPIPFGYDNGPITSFKDISVSQRIEYICRRGPPPREQDNDPNDCSSVAGIQDEYQFLTSQPSDALISTLGYYYDGSRPLLPEKMTPNADAPCSQKKIILKADTSTDTLLAGGISYNFEDISSCDTDCPAASEGRWEWSDAVPKGTYMLLEMCADTTLWSPDKNRCDYSHSFEQGSWNAGPVFMRFAHTLPPDSSDTNNAWRPPVCIMGNSGKKLERCLILNDRDIKQLYTYINQEVGASIQDVLLKVD